MSNGNDGVDFASPIGNFTSAMNSLRDFIALVNPVLQNEEKRIREANSPALIPLRFAISETGRDPKQVLDEDEKAALRAEFGAPFEVVKKEDGGHKLRIPGEAGRNFQRALSEVNRVNMHKTLLYRNSLITLASNAEWFLAEVFRGFFGSHPDAAGIKDKTLTLEDLRALGSVEDAEQFLVDLRIDEVMRGGITDWLKFLRNHMKLPLACIIDDEAKVTEIFLRRHSTVHNNGMAHPSYLKRVDETLKQGIVAGEALDLNRRYLRQSIDIVEKVFTLIACEVWKKLKPNDEVRASVLNQLTLDTIGAERYTVALGCSRFQMEDTKLSEKWVLYGKLNYWQTLKWSGKFVEVEGDVRGADFSAKEDLVQLARYVLLEEFDDAYGMVQSVLNARKLDTEALDSWPIFKEFRKDPRVAALIVSGQAAGSATVNLTDEEVQNAKNGVQISPPRLATASEPNPDVQDEL